MTSDTYVGDELELFANAVNWKAYWRSKIGPHVGRRVLEVGAGLGGTTQQACNGLPGMEQWVCLEPDEVLAAQIAARIEAGQLPPQCEARIGKIADLPESPDFDTVLYIDVLEHIDNDAAEVQRAALRLAPGGHLIVLSPAMPWLYSPFDAEIGHFRRYTRASLASIVPQELRMRQLIYLDCVGTALSLSNRVMLRSSRPTHQQIRFWDRFVVPLSRCLDPLLRYRLFGRSVLGVWQKPETT